SARSASSTRARRGSRSPSSPGPPDAVTATTPDAGLAPALQAARSRVALVVALFAVAAISWWFTIDAMQGMDEGPWTGLGTLGWFLGVWVVMMAAMMLPSLSPTVALYSRMTRERSPVLPVFFTLGYLVVWGAVGVLAFALAVMGHAVF